MFASLIITSGYGATDLDKWIKQISPNAPLTLSQETLGAPIAVAPNDPRQPVTVSPASDSAAVSITPSSSNPPNPWLEPED
jgi:hypothetical protein